MSDAERELFAYAAGFVTPADVAAFAPSDPGYPDYVAAFNRILSTGELPDRPSFDVSETIGLTRWAEAGRERNPARFRRFRVLTNAVALPLLRADVEATDALPPNYCIVSLLDDAECLDDPRLMRLSRPVVDNLWRWLSDQGSEEAPFATLGLLLLDAWQGVSVDSLSALADRLMDDERGHAGRVSGDFLLGCTYFNQLHGLWVSLVQRYLRPATPSLRLVRDAIVESGPWGEDGSW